MGEGDKWDTIAGDIVHSNVPGLEGHVAANLCDAVADALRKADSRAWNRGYGEANKEWQTAPRDSSGIF